MSRASHRLSTMLGTGSCLLTLLAGCTDQPAASSAPERAPTPELARTAAPEPEPIASPATDEATSSGPADARAVLDVRAPSSKTLVSWTLNASASPDVRVTSLRRLEEQDGEAALGAAERLLESPDSSALLRSNAVAVLARSTDPRADALLAKLDPRYQRLAQTLRDRKER